jgi:signal peptidase II
VSRELSSVKPLPDPLLGRGEVKKSGEGRGPFLFLLGGITIPIIVLDQASKLFVKAHMELYESISIIRNYFDITYTQNPGAAFSLLAQAPSWVREAFLMLLAAAAIVVLIVLVARAERVSVNSIAFAMILGGAAGNLIDRAVRGQVIDFIRVHYYDLNFPVFNVADSAITIGVALILLTVMFGDPDADASHSS